VNFIAGTFCGICYQLIAMRRERLQLVGGDWARYFAPVAICVYVAAICAAMIVTSAFLDNRHESLAISAAGLFGLVMSCALGAALLFTQLRELRYICVHTHSDVRSQYQRVLALAQDQGWRITGDQVGQRLEARTTGSVLDAGELVVVQFRPDEVLVASICDPSIGFSLVGQRRCQQNRDLVVHAVAS
jgi:hypothetical protein